jgi:hypothetical protein
MPFQINQGSSAHEEHVNVLVDGTTVVHITKQAGKKPVVSVFTDGIEATHVIDLNEAPKEFKAKKTKVAPEPEPPAE